MKNKKNIYNKQMDELDHSGSRMDAKEGNTKSSRQPLGRYWCFTQNNYTNEELDQWITIFEGDPKCKYLIEEEIGEQGTPHLQGFVQYETRIRPMEKWKTTKVHWEKCKGNEQQNLKYCTKDGKVHTNINLRQKILQDPLEGLELYDWQKEIIEKIAEEPDPRKVYWYWEKNGNKGKTSLAKHICMKRDAIYVNGKSADIKSAIADYVKVKGHGPEIVIFGIPREKEDYVTYCALEEVKDGIFFSGKYESGMVMFNTPHVIVFANFKPEVEKLSKDRWVITNISNDPESDCESLYEL